MSGREESIVLGKEGDKSSKDLGLSVIVEGNRGDPGENPVDLILDSLIPSYKDILQKRPSQVFHRGVLKGSSSDGNKVEGDSKKGEVVRAKRNLTTSINKKGEVDGGINNLFLPSKPKVQGN